MHRWGVLIIFLSTGVQAVALSCSGPSQVGGIYQLPFPGRNVTPPNTEMRVLSEERWGMHPSNLFRIIYGKTQYPRRAICNESILLTRSGHKTVIQLRVILQG
jgi:hypothetical protein